jgi:hypothetical protein
VPSLSLLRIVIQDNKGTGGQRCTRNKVQDRTLVERGRGVVERSRGRCRDVNREKVRGLRNTGVCSLDSEIRVADNNCCREVVWSMGI